MKKLKYWWWRVWTYRKEKFKVNTMGYYEAGDVVSATDHPYNILCIGKDYYIPYFYGKLTIK
jgi:hypothetical protein